ncbi:MAG: hypothetical protein A2087_10615 [Spirochaetes bacterium GWD1_61_31]|nr:MAG: hypothetical protein A2Y37_00145 [Spirochaetes bacterium GWB1_60_80]OHD32141.1 MAG: hypothetical protein A2004_05060 [Spirochaetes bacterium GWC1_61_12]OHD37124.1 MAG: hypothetical protein A2087_10615 [Spirochaetes bacterium GWD1_61_31]OHD42660.1 MAG: hypothetical protein A2Y35_12150 [Spirochaetes bacterium GWE1_60_18]OHD58541.1 MAG: hypothetical protein A2Y32_08730 [Spirochaetes bacterium GWF1_60_12]
MKTELNAVNAPRLPEECNPRHGNGMVVLFLNIILMLGAIGLMIWSILQEGRSPLYFGLGLAVSGLYLCFFGPLLFVGLKVLNPNEALVFTLFGKYHGTLKTAGFYFVNPFAAAVNPAAGKDLTSGKTDKPAAAATINNITFNLPAKKTVSLKAMTLNNDKQKVNDALGNPIVIGIVVIWKVVDTAKAVFAVDNYVEYLSIQCDAALRNIVRLYPYDSSDEEQEKSLRGSSQELAVRLQEEIQQKVTMAGIQIMEARITHLSYAPEIAHSMLQRQQASAIVAARQLIVEGAVGMVEMALTKLSEKHIVDLDEERKAAMVSNLLVVLCGNKDAQPVVNSGSIY